MILAEIRQTAAETMPDGRQRSQKADDTSGGYRPGADVKNVSAANVSRAHGADRHCSRGNRIRSVFAEELDRRDQDQISQDAAGAHDRRDARPDNVSDAEQGGRNLG